VQPYLISSIIMFTSIGPDRKKKWNWLRHTLRKLICQICNGVDIVRSQKKRMAEKHLEKRFSVRNENLYSP